MFTKTYILFVFIILSFFSCTPNKNNLITEKSVGKFRLDDSFEQVSKKIDSLNLVDFSLSNLRNAESEYYLVLNNEVKMKLYFWEDKLRGIRVLSKDYATNNNTSIGDTYEKVNNSGYRTWALWPDENSIRAQVKQKNNFGNYDEVQSFYFYFQRKFRPYNSSEISETSQLKMIQIGHYPIAE